MRTTLPNRYRAPKRKVAELPISPCKNESPPLPSSSATSSSLLLSKSSSISSSSTSALSSLSSSCPRANVIGLSDVTHCRWQMNSGSVPCFAIVVSWRTVRCLTAIIKHATYQMASLTLTSPFSCMLTRHLTLFFFR